MDVSQLDELFDIVEYQPDKIGRATIELVNGSLQIRFPYHFHSASATSPKVMVDGETTPTQLADLKTMLVQILQATNTAIETEHGWTKRIEAL